MPKNSAAAGKVSVNNFVDLTSQVEIYEVILGKALAAIFIFLNRVVIRFYIIYTFTTPLLEYIKYSI